MRVTLQKILPTAGNVLDATPFLDESQKQIATQELEFNSFQRTMPDIMLSLSDLGAQFTTFFSGIRASDLIQCELYDDTGRRRFWGYVDNKSITFLLRDRYAKFSAYSGMKRFWERAKATTFYNKPIAFGLKTMTLDTFFLMQSMLTNIRGDERLFDSIDLGILGSESVRGDDTYHGTLENLDPKTTWYDFMAACSLFFNAEFYIDPESRALRMVHRVSVMNDRELDLDDRLCDDEEVEASAIDAKRVDYVKSFGWYSIAAPTQVFKPETIASLPYGYPQTGVGAGVHYYSVVYYTNGQPAIISDVLTVELPDPPSGYNWKVWIQIPAHPAVAGGERKVYRSDAADTSGGWHLMYELGGSDSLDKAVSDIMNWQYLQYQAERPWVDRTVGAWYTFDELTDEWTKILDAPKGEHTPSGAIFDIIPTLHFMSPYDRSKPQEDDPFNVFQFFVEAFNVAEEPTRTRWADLFRTRRIVKCKVTGIDYEVGDSVVSSRGLFPNDLTADKRLVIRKAVCNLMDNTSQLELVTV